MIPDQPERPLDHMEQLVNRCQLARCVCVAVLCEYNLPVLRCACTLAAHLGETSHKHALAAIAGIPFETSADCELRSD